jgi:hypothetical protein
MTRPFRCPGLVDDPQQANEVDGVNSSAMPGVEGIRLHNRQHQNTFREKEMRRRARLFIWVFFSMTVVTHMACADEVVLDNGDRITGKLVRLKEGKLIFKTDYAGEITIQAKRVSRLATDKPVETTLLDVRIRKASIFSRYVPVGDVHSEVEKSPKDIDSAQVKDIYTKPKPVVRINSRLNVGIMNEKGNSDTEQ